MHSIIVSTHVFQDVLQELAVNRGMLVSRPATHCICDQSAALIVSHSTGPGDRSPAVLFAQSSIDLSMPAWAPRSSQGVVLLGTGTLLGQAAAFWVDEPDRCHSIDSLRLMGPGMHVLPTSVQGGDLRETPILEAARLRYSRTLAALGEDVWARLVSLRYGIIGTGRTGGMMARQLLGIGAGRITLVDPDILEPHNLGEADDLLLGAHPGSPKAMALAHGLSRLWPQARIHVVCESVSHRRAMEALKACDILICTCDHDSARLAASCLAALYSRVLLDVASGIPRDPTAAMGVTIRLTLPSEGCLVCLGGLDLAASQAVLRTGPTEREFHAYRDGLSERGGSLASLNRLAVSLAQRMIEDLVRERLTNNVWLQLDYDNDGRASLAYPTGRAPTGGCPVCRRLTGLGDSGIQLVPNVIHALSADLTRPTP